MFTPTQIEIIKAFGSKELSFWCRLVIDDLIYIYVGRKKLFEDIWNWKIWDPYSNDEYDEILWHIPELHDLYRIAQSKNWYITVHNHRLIIDKESDKPLIMGTSYEILLDISYKPELQLIDQEESTLVQLLNLFK